MKNRTKGKLYLFLASISLCTMLYLIGGWIATTVMLVAIISGVLMYSGIILVIENEKEKKE